MSKYKVPDTVLFMGEAFNIAKVYTGPQPRPDYLIASISDADDTEEVLEDELLPAP